MTLVKVAEIVLLSRNRGNIAAIISRCARVTSQVHLIIDGMCADNSIFVLRPHYESVSFSPVG